MKTNNNVMPLSNLNEIVQDCIFFCLFVEIKKN